MLTAITDDIHSVSQDFSFSGFRLGRRGTVVRLDGDSLLVHSPVPLTPELKAEVDGLGTVRHIVAPNLFHHLWAPEWAAAYPDATVHAPVGIEKKQKALGDVRTLDGTPDPDWGGVLTPLLFEGMPDHRETNFLHEASGTLISSDLALALPAEIDHWATRWYAKLCGIQGKPLGCSFVHKLWTKDKAAARRSVDRILELAPQRAVMSHRNVIDGPDTTDALREAWAWLRP